MKYAKNGKCLLAETRLLKEVAKIVCNSHSETHITIAVRSHSLLKICILNRLFSLAVFMYLIGKKT